MGISADEDGEEVPRLSGAMMSHGRANKTVVCFVFLFFLPLHRRRLLTLIMKSSKITGGVKQRLVQCRVA